MQSSSTRLTSWESRIRPIRIPRRCGSRPSSGVEKPAWWSQYRGSNRSTAFTSGRGASRSCAGGRSRPPRAPCPALRRLAAGRTIGRGLAATARVEQPAIRSRVIDGPYFDNQVATLRIRGRRLELDIDMTVAGDLHPRLERICRRRLA
jgi:hypothetical protein